LHQLGVEILTAILSLAAYWEFLTMLLDKQHSGFQVKRAYSVAVAFLTLLLFYLHPEWHFAPLFLALFCFLASLLFIGHREKTNAELLSPLRDALVQIGGFFYIVIFLQYVPRVHALDAGPSLMFLLLLVIWGGDSAAYYGGKTFGRHKLSPLLSPGKSVEGSITAILFSLLTAAALHFLLLPQYGLWQLCVLCGASSIVAQAGDLLESLVKRAAEVKDSGHIFPGHGGVYDRFDSLILSAPFFYFLIQILA
jgi:CDP-diglyceride synthetase